MTDAALESLQDPSEAGVASLDQMPLAQRIRPKPQIIEDIMIQGVMSVPNELSQPVPIEYHTEGNMDIQYSESDKRGDKCKAVKGGKDVESSHSEVNAVGGKRGRTRAEDSNNDEP